MSANQDHHYLPQSYQRGWAAKGQIVVFQWRHRKLDVRRKSTSATGSRPGLYYIPMAPAEKRNFMEDVFWRQIDQWGADNLALLRNSDPSAATKIEKERLAIFIMSFQFRNPRKISEIQALARAHLLRDRFKEVYGQLKRPHEPPTFEEFQRALDQPGLTELTAEALCKFVKLPAVKEKLLKMEWQVVGVPNGFSLLTSDVPLILHKGLQDDDGLLILPLSPREFFVAYNRGSIDMKSWIDASIESGTFVDGINRFVVRQKIDFVYAHDDSQKDFIYKNWPVNWDDA